MMKLINKYSVLSVIARIYDPLGRATRASSDARQNLHARTLAIKNRLGRITAGQTTSLRFLATYLPVLNKVRIPRWTGQTLDQTPCYGVPGYEYTFSHAYEAVVYIRVPQPPAAITVSLVLIKPN